MPTPLLNSAVPAAGWSLLSPQVATILELELANQLTLASMGDVTVFHERVAAPSLAELPCVFVSLEDADVEGNTYRDSKSDCKIQIDVFASEKGSGTETGAKLANKYIHKVAGMIRGILDSPHYSQLGFSSTVIERRNITGLKMGKLGGQQDSAAISIGTLTYQVKIIDDNLLQSTATLDSSQSVIKLSDTDKGHKILESW